MAAALHTMHAIAEGLGYHAEWTRWSNLQFLLAEAVLAQDSDAAWDRVRLELEKQRYLTGDEVRALASLFLFV